MTLSSNAINGTARHTRLNSLTFLLALLLAAVPVMADEQNQQPPSEPSAPAAAVPPQGSPRAFKPPTFADDTMTYVFGPDYRNPFVKSPEQPDGADITRNAIEFKHIDSWKYGTNLAEIMIKKSDLTEPAVRGGTGVLALYAVFRSGIGINRVAGRPIVAWGPLRDIAVQVGVNLETKNSSFAPEERSLLFGTNFQFRFGAGFLNVGTNVRKEWNHNGFTGMAESYDPSFSVEPVWHVPFKVGGAKLAFDGFAGFNSAKGKDSSGDETRPAFVTRPQLKLDASRLLGLDREVLEAGVGFEFWHNMFGKDADLVPGANQMTPIFTLTVHLPMGSAGH